MSLFSRAFDGVPVIFTTTLDASDALAKLTDLMRWAPGKPLLTGTAKPDRVELAFACGSSYGRGTARFEGVIESAEGGCLLKGRFVSPISARVCSAFFLLFAMMMALGGLATGLGQLGSRTDSPREMAFAVLGLLVVLLLLGVMGMGILWNAVPSRCVIRDMTKHIEGALSASVAE